MTSTPNAPCRYGTEIENKIAETNKFRVELCTKGFLYIRGNLMFYHGAWTGWTVTDNNREMNNRILFKNLKTMHEAMHIIHCIEHDKPIKGVDKPSKPL
jgi:hypothetical protein